MPKLVNEAVKKEVEEEEERLCKKEKKSLLIPMCIYSGGHSGGAWGCPPYQGQWVLQEIWEAHLWRLILRKKVLSASAALNVAVQHFRMNSIERSCPNLFILYRQTVFFCFGGQKNKK